MTAEGMTNEAAHSDVVSVCAASRVYGPRCHGGHLGSSLNLAVAQK